MRYYAPWLCRWISPDPGGLVEGPNLYRYARNNPIANTNSAGMYCDPTSQSCLDPSEPTAREEALQQSLPEDERYLPPPPDKSLAPAVAPVPSVQVHEQSGPQWELGPRGERIPTQYYQGGELQPIDQYTKPYAVIHAQAGNYEAAELAENYLCATCHVLTKVDARDVSIGGYSRGWQRGYIQGFVEVPLKATPIGAAWEIGVSGGQAITGESSGLHISNISSVVVDDHWDVGRTLSTGERAWEGVNFAVGAATLGYARFAAGAPRPPVASSGATSVDDLLMGARPGVGLPGRAGIPIARRPTLTEMENLSAKHGVEFAVTYKYGPGPNGGGGQYWLYSGTSNRVAIPLEADNMFIYHTHPNGAMFGSGPDRAVMDFLLARSARRSAPPTSFRLAAAGHPEPSACLLRGTHHDDLAARRVHLPLGRIGARMGARPA